MREQGAAIVTGGAGCLGRAISLRLARDGWAVAIADVSADAAERTARELGSSDLRMVGLRLDVTSRESWTEALDRTRRTLGDVSVLVNNAGIIRDASLRRMSDRDWVEVVDVHLKGTFLGCQIVGLHMVRRCDGRIVNLASTAYLGSFGQANYSAAKGGIVSMTRTAAIEYARYGVRVNAIAPGGVESPMLRTVPGKLLEEFRARVPLGRFAEPSEVASVVAFLSGPDSSYVTGQVVHVCGGASLGA